MIDPVVQYIMIGNSSLIPLYVYDVLEKYGVDVHQLLKNLRSGYGEYFTPQQFIEYGEKYLDQILIEQQQITFHELLSEAFKTIRHRFAHQINN